jgi:hypothetical protein
MYANQPEAGSGRTETFNIDPGGNIGGFVMKGSGSANQIGIQSSGVQNERWDDITFSGFTGIGAVSWNLYNSDTSNGWQERTQATKIRVLNGGGLKFSYNTKANPPNPAAASFGYSKFEVTCDSAGSPACFDMQSGRLYNSDLTIMGNVLPTGTLVSSEGDMDLNRYLIVAEPLGSGGKCIDVAPHGEMEGIGTISCQNLFIVNENANSFAPTLRIMALDTSAGNALLNIPPGTGTNGASQIGTMSNFLGTTNTGSAQVAITHDMSNPYASFGTIHGPFIDSTFTSMQNVGTNAHVFYACPFAYSDLNSCTIVGEVTNSGVGRFVYNGYFPFSTDPVGLPNAYCWWNGTEQRLKCSDGAQVQTVAWKTNLPLTGTTTTLPPATIFAGTCTGITASVPGATSTMAVVATPASYTRLDVGLHWDTAFVSSPGTVLVPVCNETANSITPSSTPAFNVRVIQ